MSSTPLSLRAQERHVLLVLSTARREETPRPIGAEARVAARHGDGAAHLRALISLSSRSARSLFLPRDERLIEPSSSEASSSSLVR